LAILNAEQGGKENKGAIKRIKNSFKGRERTIFLLFFLKFKIKMEENVLEADPD
jgi:hypothetical protein